MPRKRIVWVTDYHDMISAVYHGCTARNQMNKSLQFVLHISLLPLMFVLAFVFELWIEHAVKIPQTTKPF